MATPHPALDAAVNQFAQQPGVTPDQVESLRSARSSDTDLSQRLCAEMCASIHLEPQERGRRKCVTDP